MISHRLRKRSFWLAHLGLVATLAIPAGAEAQQTRVQVAGSNLFSSGDVHVLYGADGGTVFGGGDCVPGGAPCDVPEWGLVVGAYGGFVPTEDIPLSIYSHVGIEYMLTEDFGLALLGFGFAQPLHGGVALRLDALDVGALKAGYGWGEVDGFLIGVEVALEFLRDLGR